MKDIQVDAAVRGGVTSLCGRVDRQSTEDLAVRLARQVAGVVEVPTPSNSMSMTATARFPASRPAPADCRYADALGGEPHERPIGCSSPGLCVSCGRSVSDMVIEHELTAVWPEGRLGKTGPLTHTPVGGPQRCQSAMRAAVGKPPADVDPVHAYPPSGPGAANRRPPNSR